jgi:hypothetical protein
MSVQKGCSVAQVVSCWLLVAEARVPSQASPCKISGGQSVIGTGFSPSTSVFPCQYHSTIAPYSFIHLPHTRCIMFFSQCFSFPVSVSFHHCSILIHSKVDNFRNL